MTQDQLGDLLARVSGGIDEVDFVDAAWAGARRRQQRQGPGIVRRAGGPRIAERRTGPRPIEVGQPGVRQAPHQHSADPAASWRCHVAAHRAQCRRGVRGWRGHSR